MCRPRSAQFSLYSHPSCALWAADLLVNQTANLLCPLALTDIAYSGVAAPPSPVSTDDDDDDDSGVAAPPSPVSTDDDDDDDSGVAAPPLPVSTDDNKLPGWGIAIIVIAMVLLFAVLLFAIMMYRAEKRGKPIFVSLNDIQEANAKAQAQA